MDLVNFDSVLIVNLSSILEIGYNNFVLLIVIYMFGIAFIHLSGLKNLGKKVGQSVGLGFGAKAGADMFDK
jgi:hypothetical protein